MLLLITFPDFNLTVTNQEPLINDNIEFSCLPLLTDIITLPVTYTFWARYDQAQPQAYNFSCPMDNAVITWKIGTTQWSTRKSTDHPFDCILEIDNLAFLDSGTFQCTAFKGTGDLLFSNCVTVSVYIPITPAKYSTTLPVVVLAILAVIVSVVILMSFIYCTRILVLRRERARHGECAYI